MCTEGKHTYKSNVSSYSSKVSRAQHVSKTTEAQEKLLNKFTKSDIKNIHHYCSASPADTLVCFNKKASGGITLEEAKVVEL